MATTPKRPSKPTTKLTKLTTTPRVKRPAKATSSSTKPFLRFYHSESLREKTLAVITDVEKAKDTKPHRNALADIVAELTDSGLDFYFMQPLKLAKAGFFAEQSANLGIGAAKRVFGSVIRNIIGGMDGPQLLSVCRSIRQFMK
ncbi:MAG: hypothetical protein ABSF64_15590 [Bryobacteraceae bacterium]